MKTMFRIQIEWFDTYADNCIWVDLPSIPRINEYIRMTVFGKRKCGIVTDVYYNFDSNNNFKYINLLVKTDEELSNIE